MITSVPLTAKHADGVPRVISVGRLSQPKDTPAETEQSLVAMRQENERFLSIHFPGPKIIHYLGEQVSGMLATRQTIFELWELIEKGESDAVVAEDLSRIFRNPRYQWEFVQDAVDAGIRVICFADGLDTADENWETSVMLATMRHGLTIPDTRRRIKRTATTSFHEGGQVAKVKYGYARVSKEDAAAGTCGPKGLRMRRITECQSVFDQIRQRAHQGYSPQSIVDWLNAEAIAVGRYAKKGRWTLKLFRDLITDPLLHGERTFRRIVHTQVFRTGKYRKSPNASPETEVVPELAFMSRDEHLALLSAVGWKMRGTDPKLSPNPHPRKGLPRGRVCWPGQSVTCSACDEIMYQYGKSLRCRNSHRSRGQTCWNHVQVPLARMRHFIVTWLVDQFNASSAFRDVFLPAVREQLDRQRQSRDRADRQKEDSIRALEQRERNLLDAIRIAEAKSGTPLESLVENLLALTEELKATKESIHSSTMVKSPLYEMSDDKIAGSLEEVLPHLVCTSYEMAEVIRGFVTRCTIVPVQLLDGGQVYPRAKLLVQTFHDNLDNNELATQRELTVDLFNAPVHIRVLQEAVRLRSQQPRPTLAKIGRQLEVSHVTIKRALNYHQLMIKSGAAEPFVELQERPKNAARWRHAS